MVEKKSMLKHITFIFMLITAAYAITAEEWIHKVEKGMEQSDPGLYQKYLSMPSLEKAGILQDVARQQYAGHQSDGLVQNDPGNLPPLSKNRMDFSENLSHIPSEAQLITTLDKRSTAL